MIIRSVNLETVCGISSQLPDHILPECAFTGRSNVGKSSLINVLMNRKAYARTSAQPGKTQTMNYYNINGQFYLVDLPGYGYARASQDLRIQWGKMTERYLRSSRQLKCVFLLADIRHEPSAGDAAMYRNILQNGFRPLVIATKSDKISRNQLPKQLKVIRTCLKMKQDDILIPFSALTRQGREEIFQILETYLET